VFTQASYKHLTQDFKPSRPTY